MSKLRQNMRHDVISHIMKSKSTPWRQKVHLMYKKNNVKKKYVLTSKSSPDIQKVLWLQNTSQKSQSLSWRPKVFNFVPSNIMLWHPESRSMSWRKKNHVTSLKSTSWCRRVKVWCQKIRMTSKGKSKVHHDIKKVCLGLRNHHMTSTNINSTSWWQIMWKENRDVTVCYDVPKKVYYDVEMYIMVVSKMSYNSC